MTIISERVSLCIIITIITIIITIFTFITIIIIITMRRSELQQLLHH